MFQSSFVQVTRAEPLVTTVRRNTRLFSISSLSSGVFSALILRFSSTLATTRLLIRVEWLEQDNSLRLGVILGEVFLASPDECVYSKLLMTPSGRWSAETFSPLIGQSGPDSACDWSDSAALSHQGPSSLKGAPLRHQPSSFPLSPSQVQHNTPSLSLDLGDLA